MRAARLVLLSLTLVPMASAPSRADGDAILKDQCGSCHALEKPADPGFGHVWDRKAPDLHYAGVKFQRDWLVAWLQDPKPIRPTAYPVFRNLAPGPEHDRAQPAADASHPKLAAADAGAVADALMARRGPDGLVEPGAFKNQKPNRRLAAMAFKKLRGCAACHQGEGGEGGLSGPSLAEAGARLQPDFVASYILDPQKFDPHVWMPALEMSDQDVQRLTGYLAQLGGGAP